MGELNVGISTENDRLTVIISKELKQQLKELATVENRSLSNFVVTILESFASEQINKSNYKNDSD